MLVKAYSTEEIAESIGVTVRSIQNYLSETKPTTPHPDTLRKIDETFAKYREGKPISGQMKGLSTSMDGDITSRYIDLLEVQVKDRELLKEVLQRLGEISNDLYVFAAMQKAWQEFWTEHVPLKQKMNLEEVRDDIRKRAFETYEKIEAEGIQIV